ncbi:SigE family RNA polymerase sigma factor [Micromonospora sp. NPDC049679]|uniref:SigE family RNA polymerase sigma factor n=1 Tax=Micromonospora sp. NPDC049679 TaxID=3155920 RepID=UPI0033CCE25E
MRAELEREYVEYVKARLPVLRRVAYQLTGDAHRGDDVVQQAITRLYLKWKRAREADNLDAYAHTVLVRVFLDEKRLSWSRVRLVGAVPERPSPASTAVEDRAVLRAALAQVPPRQRAVLVLRFLADRSVDEVAGILGCTTGTVKSQTSHGLASMRRLLGNGAFVSTGTGE